MQKDKELELELLKQKLAGMDFHREMLEEVVKSIKKKQRSVLMEIRKMENLKSDGFLQILPLDKDAISRKIFNKN